MTFHGQDDWLILLVLSELIFSRFQSGIFDATPDLVNIPLLVNNTCVSMCVLAAVLGYCRFIRVNANSSILHQLCSHFAGGTTAGRSRVLISLLETQLSDRSVWCPDWDMSSLTLGQV